MWNPVDLEPALEMQKNGHVNEGYAITENEKNGRLSLDVEKDPSKQAIDNNNDAGTETTKKGVQERPTWSNGVEFLMSCIAMSVGLGNIWRFPFTAYENGGGAFLIPYIIVLFVVGKPMYYMEMALGQFSGRNSIRMWAITPGLKGVGVGQVIGTTCIVTYYVSLMALTLFYLIQSFQAELPWASCKPEWGPNCYSTSNNSEDSTNKTSSSEHFFLREVLRQKESSIDDGIGSPDWRLTLCLLAAWTGVFLVMLRGVKSSGKASYFLALFPYVVMFALLIRAVTLEGAIEGIKFFITPKWEELYNPQVWYAAVTQVFFSLGVCLGPILIFATYNDFNGQIYRDAMIVTTLDTFTSLLAGFTIFGILGNLAHEKGEADIGKVIGAGGTGLAFISYPDAISKFTWVPQLFAVLFFLMLLVLGLGSAVSLQSTIVTVMADRFRNIRYWQISLGCCLTGFIVGLVYITPGGQWILTLVDQYGGTFLILGLAIAEITGVFWIYGLENFCEDLEFMTNRKVTVYWRYCWGIVTPILMLVVFLYAFISMKPLSYGDFGFPHSAIAAGWTLLAIGLLQLPIWGIVRCLRNRTGSTTETVKNAFTASEKWGPNDPKIRAEWKAFKEQAKKEREAKGASRFMHIVYSLNGTYRRHIKLKEPTPNSN